MSGIPLGLGPLRARALVGIGALLAFSPLLMPGVASLMRVHEHFGGLLSLASGIEEVQGLLQTILQTITQLAQTQLDGIVHYKELLLLGLGLGLVLAYLLSRRSRKNYRETFLRL